MSKWEGSFVKIACHYTLMITYTKINRYSCFAKLGALNISIAHTLLRALYNLNSTVISKDHFVFDISHCFIKLSARISTEPRTCCFDYVWTHPFKKAENLFQQISCRCVWLPGLHCFRKINGKLRASWNKVWRKKFCNKLNKLS